jgi:hypothetical protein
LQILQLWKKNGGGDIMELKKVAHYESPQMETFANTFITWLTRKLNGSLPAPHVRLVGASEELWPALYQTAKLTGGENGFADWCEKSDACAFPFLELSSKGEPRRLDHATKSQLLPLLFPCYENDFLETLLDYDAVVFLRLDRLPNIQRQAVVTAHETAYLCSVWLRKALIGQNSAGNVEEEQILSWLDEYSADREQQ